MSVPTPKTLTILHPKERDAGRRPMSGVSPFFQQSSNKKLDTNSKHQNIDASKEITWKTTLSMLNTTNQTHTGSSIMKTRPFMADKYLHLFKTKISAIYLTVALKIPHVPFKRWLCDINNNLTRHLETTGRSLLSRQARRRDHENNNNR